MILKKLNLLGFKTFADKTEVEFGQGVTAIVGPNGSGKSNISDALTWVLGESNVRNIRGQRATDVIFNGSEKRRAHGLAEVSLTLDNSCRTLPLDFSEVTVTRRAYRSGEGEYFINKTRCRLKDIYELFLDTGMSSDAYSFVSQGEIDAILSAKPEDRRELFEEAAGVKKYRYRREEALRKMERTEANLRRVCDIMAEIGSQVEPLAQQAEKAKRFQELQSRLWDIEIGLLIKDLKRFSALLEQVREARMKCASKLEEFERRMVGLDKDKQDQTASLASLEEEVENARRVQQSIAGNLQRLESKCALLEERLRSAVGTRSKTDEETIQLQQKIEDMRRRLITLDAQMKSETESEASARAETERRTHALEVTDKQFEDVSRSLNNQKSEFVDRANDLAAKRGSLQSAKDRIAQLEAALEKRGQDVACLQTQQSEAGEKSVESERVVDDITKKVAGLESKLPELKKTRESANAEVSALNHQRTELARDAAGRISRLATLQEMAHAREGYFEGVRSVMKASGEGKLKGAYAVIADVMKVAEGCERAIEVALGANLQNVVVDYVSEATDAIGFLKVNQAGRATFLPLDGIRPPSAEVRGKMDRQEGALGLATNHVHCDRKYQPAIDLLLARTVIADNIDNAIALSRRLNGWDKIVTLDGELVRPTGEITGGFSRKTAPSLLIRKKEIESLIVEIGELEKTASQTETALGEAVTRRSDNDAQVSAAEQSLSEERIALAEQKRRAEFAQVELKRFVRELEIMSKETDDTRGRLEKESAEASRFDEELRNAGSESSDLDKEAAGSQEVFESLQKQRDAERAELMRANVELASHVERLAALKNAANDAKVTLGELERSLVSRHTQIEELGESETVLSGEQDTVSRECATQRDLLSAADKTLNESIATRTAEMQKAAEIDAQLKQVSDQRNLIAQEAHEAEVKEARLEVQMNQATERLLTEYELSYEKAMEWPEEEIEVERGAATEVMRLRREIKEMGAVNTGAVEEYDRIRERWDFLTEQRQDLESAKDQINSAIKEIDSSTHGMFMETFNAVAANFDVVLKRLFGGGRTELTLTDPGNLLDTGINVSVQPPGKKLQDLSLLSGGERSLIAVALLFALLMVRPSPFVVMDEVDAALDESNVERFAEVLKEFAEKSQFIVVTHNRATMEAAAGLYGITMDEPGVSKLLSVRLAAEGSIANEIEGEAQFGASPSRI